MSDSELDWASLSENTETRRARYRFDDVKSKFKKIAFDVYKPTGASAGDAQLWELRDEGGEKFLYAIYEQPTDLTATSALIDWTATSDRDGKNVTLSFKNTPLVRYASAQHGFEPDEANGFAEFLQTKVQDQEFATQVVAQLAEPKQVLFASLLRSRN